MKIIGKVMKIGMIYVDKMILPQHSSSVVLWNSGKFHIFSLPEEKQWFTDHRRKSKLIACFFDAL